MLLVQNIGFSYAHRPLFAGLSFQLKMGDLLHLKGPNGSGKSTLLSVIAGLRAPSSGNFMFRKNSGEEDGSGDLRPYVSYLAAESNGLYGSLPAEDNLRFWASLSGVKEPAERSSHCLQFWGLSHQFLRGVPVGKFSTGMKRRLGLARVQLAGRFCMLLDEPINGLDRHSVSLFRKMLSEHLNSGGAAILVSHETRSLEDLLTQELSLS